MVEESRKSGGFIDIVKALLADKGFIAAIAAVVLSTVSLCLGGSVNSLYFSIISALLLAISNLVIHVPLVKWGIVGSLYKEAEKRVSPGIIGSIGDINGVGSTIAIAAAVALVFGKTYIVDGGIVGSDSFAGTFTAVIAEAVCAAAALGAMTSAGNIRNRLIVTVSRDIDRSLTPSEYKRKLFYNCEKLCHNSGEMDEIRGMCVVRLCAMLSTAAIMIIGVLSGSDSPFVGCIPALISLVVTLLSRFCVRRSAETVITEEKQHLWNEKSKRILAVNTIVYLLAGIFFLYSFPIRSVYTEYEIQTEFYYSDSYDGEIHIFSVPDSDCYPLFIAFSLVTVLSLCSMIFALNADGADFLLNTSSKHSTLGAACGVIIAVSAAAIITGMLVPQLAIDPIGWLTVFTFGAFFLLVNIITHFTILRNK